MNVSENDSSISLDLAIETSKYYGVPKSKAGTTAMEIVKVVQENWERLAKKYGIGHSSIENMRPAFLI